MAAEAVASNRQGFFARVRDSFRAFATFSRESFHEVRHKTTWPDVPQVRQASIAIIIFVLVIGLVITLLDLVLRGVLVSLIPSLFR